MTSRHGIAIACRSKGEASGPTAPILVDITVEGRQVKAVAQLTKQGFVFVLDRATGQPAWPIEERPVPKSEVPGEWTSPTQPFPTRPAAVELQGVTENDLVDFTPEIKAEALRVASQHHLSPLYTPSSLPKTADGKLGTLSAPSAVGGVNWPGGAVDPRRIAETLDGPGRCGHDMRPYDRSDASGFCSVVPLRATGIRSGTATTSKPSIAEKSSGLQV